jgi:hypothetical protein
MTNIAQAKLEEDFHEDMWQMIRTQKKDYPAWPYPSRFAQMLESYGGVHMAHKLLSPNADVPITFEILRKENRPDLAMEHYVLLDKYRSLFNDKERETAKARLDYGA